MKTIDINLASKPFHNNTLFYLFHGLLISLVLFATALNGYFFFHYRTFEKDLRDKVAGSQMNIRQLDQKVKRILEAISRKDMKSITQKADFANSAIVMRKFSWTGLFNDLERVLPYSVRMQSIRPNVKERGIEVRVDGLAKDLRSFLEFEKNLQEDANFARVRPENYRKMGQSDLTFSLLFEYHPQDWSIEEIYTERDVLMEELKEEQIGPQPQEQEEQVNLPPQEQMGGPQERKAQTEKSQG